MSTEPSPPPAQLMLALEASAGAADCLSAILSAVPVASVVLRPVTGRPLTAEQARPLVALGQKAGAAMLIEADAELARALGADGVHIPVSDDPLAAFQAARAWVGGRAIVGVDAGRSRDAAMSLGELGADYIAFGIPAFVKERAGAIDRRLDLVAWWAEIFEVPVVAMDVDGPEEAYALASAGADFVCLALAGGIAVADAEARARVFADAVLDAAEAGTRHP